MTLSTTTEHIKTLRDCAGCGKVGYCDAHISGGTHNHRAGPNPCKVVIEG